VSQIAERKREMAAKATHSTSDRRGFIQLRPCQPCSPASASTVCLTTATMDSVQPNRIVMKIEATVRNSRAQYSVYVLTGPDTSGAQLTTGDYPFGDYDELFAEVLENTAKLLRKGIKQNQRQIQIRIP
jgi:hypothetical protein